MPAGGADLEAFRTSIRWSLERMGLFVLPVSAAMVALALPAAAALLIATIVLEIGAGVMLVIGFKTRWAALALAAFLVPTTVIFHAFWAADAAQYQEQLTAFLKNGAILGGVLMVAAQAHQEQPTGLVHDVGGTAAIAAGRRP